MADRETIGELKETSGELNIEWEIANFFSLSEEVDKFYNSPLFCFSGTTLYLQIYPNGQRSFNSEGFIGIYAVRGDSGPPRCLTYNFFLKTANGKKVKVTDDRKTFKEKHYGWGSAKSVCRSNLLKRKSELAPFDFLTIVCYLKQDDELVAGSINYFSIGIRDTFSWGTNHNETSQVANLCVKEPEKAGVHASTQTEAEVAPGIEKLAQNLKELMLSGDDSDVTIRVKGTDFRLHKNILGARTPVFNSMFRHEMTEKTTGMVSIDDCESDTFHSFLHYAGRVDRLSPENVFGLYEVADKYQVDELKSDCLECMKNTLSVDTFFDAVSLALQHDENELMELAVCLLSDKLIEITGTVKWLTFLKKHPTQANELLRKSLINKEKKD